jgi:hypothetical protein
MIVRKIDARLAQRMEVGRIGWIDGIRTQAVPDEDDDFSLLRRGTTDPLQNGGEQCQGGDPTHQSTGIPTKHPARLGHGSLPRSLYGVLL